MNIVVPEGCLPGEVFTVEYNGAIFDIAAPDGVEPGQEFTVELEVQSSMGDMGDEHTSDFYARFDA